ncbi:phosphoribosylformimino-5-aminoimidazole carboxamide ribotide isomerase [Methanococcus maripaludis]|uniref:Phosphoribosylformimino-5-aminoimidazole carboxamide ribotide isomerase n=1 Tax=Methanococcus maripaludis TaxID=39152 RepID=A0A7J9NQ54_METMI|nr:HisA/HisF family protein [Methanococcus maripaludis]MBA2847593.1 phosphoribosylformimino-5-aminoimidazole carboxamide ribotide isomerase [Methanococcus maripaludis]MBA2857333.1 phosphoribosylformimino-5-aminoimidazole carboxamide ribotide isomerase [Methanococcus maripaludis]
MEIIPVIDLMNGLAVSGKSGNRKEYIPIKSVLCDSSNPVDVIKKYKENGAKKVYIADLNSIMSTGNNFEIVKSLDIFKIVDFGVTDKKDLENVKKYVNMTILGTETLNDISILKEENIILSLDFKDGKLLNYDLDEILSEIDKNTPLIILDISSVGTQKGINVELIKDILKKTDNPIYIGGGIKSEDDLKISKELGISGVLIGTTIHNGKLDLKKIIQKYGE